MPRRLPRDGAAVRDGAEPADGAVYDLGRRIGRGGFPRHRFWVDDVDTRHIGGASEESSEQGVLSYTGLNLTNKLIVFASNILIVRFLTQDEYGVFSYANSIYSIVLLFTGLGLISGLLQFSSEKRPVEEKFEIQRYVLTVGLFIDAVIMMLLVFVGYGAGLSIAGSGHCLAMLAPLIPLDYFFQYASSILRSRKLNKEYSLLLNVNTIGYTGLSCVGAFAAGVPGVISVGTPPTLSLFLSL